MAQQKPLKQLSKFISYILGRNPAEFGLVPDPDGFVKIKEFLKAVSEEEGLKYVRRSTLNEMLISLPNPPIEIRDNLIRAKNRQHLSGYIPARNLPKLLYSCVRRKAYPVVFEKGIFPAGFSHVILSSEPEMAERIGRRKDSMPVLLVVQTQKSMDSGTIFYEAGKPLYLAESIHPDCFTGPPLPKQKEAFHKHEIPEEQAPHKMPGSFLMELKDQKAYGKASQRRKDRKATTQGKDSEKIKKQKRKRERPPWRR